MVDELIDVEGAGGIFREANPVHVVNFSDASANGSAAPSLGNSSQTPLAANDTFTGSWEVNSFEHVLVNVTSDKIGTLIVDFAIVKDGVDLDGAIADADVIVTLAAPQPVYAGAPYFRALVKGAGRAYRLRYVNGPDAQTEFALLSSYGSNIFPPSTSADNELLVTVKESERSHFVAMNAADVAATQYGLLIDLDDTAEYPHENVGRIDLSAIYLNLDRQNTSQGTVQLGIITRIDGTSADIQYVQGIAFEKASTTSINRDRIFSPNRLKCGVVGGTLKDVATSFRAVNIAEINTGITLPNSIGGTATPAVGDAIIRFAHTTGGTYDATVSGFYFTEKSA